MGKCHLMTK